MLKYLGIDFHDNDFYSTFKGVLTTIYNRQLDSEYASGQLPVDKERLKLLIDSLAFGHYLLCQNRFDYNSLENMNNDYIFHMRKYLTVAVMDIYVNEEVFQFLSDDEQFKNGEFFWIDLETGEFQSA